MRIFIDGGYSDQSGYGRAVGEIPDAHRVPMYPTHILLCTCFVLILLSVRVMKVEQRFQNPTARVLVRSRGAWRPLSRCVFFYREEFGARLVDGDDDDAVPAGQLGQQHDDLIGRHAVQPRGGLVQQDDPCP